MSGPGLLCVGAVHWDVIGRCAGSLARGDDRPGIVTRQPGGVAFNIARHLVRHGLRPSLLSAVGRDAEGAALLAACDVAGIGTAPVLRTDAPTGRYLAIEDDDGLVAAVADTAALEGSGVAILAPLEDGTLPCPYPGPVTVDGNLTAPVIARLAGLATDLRAVAASNAKARHLIPLMGRPEATLYLNLAEAAALAGCAFGDAAAAAEALAGPGRARVLVTDGARPAALGTADGVTLRRPPEVAVRRVTGAGDCLMAAHLAADLRGLDPAVALDSALTAAARFVAAMDDA